MSEIRITRIDRRLAKKVTKVIDKAGIDVLAISGGVLAGSTSACVLKATATAAGLTEKSAPLNAAINLGCTVAVFVSHQRPLPSLRENSWKAMSTLWKTALLPSPRSTMLIRSKKEPVAFTAPVLFLV